MLHSEVVYGRWEVGSNLLHAMCLTAFWQVKFYPTTLVGSFRQGLPTIVAPKTCENKLLGNVTFNIVSIFKVLCNTSLKLKSIFWITKERSWNSATDKLELFVTIVNTLILKYTRNKWFHSFAF